MTTVLDALHVALSVTALAVLVAAVVVFVAAATRPACTRCGRGVAAAHDHLCLDCRLAEFDRHLGWNRNNLEDAA